MAEHTNPVSFYFFGLLSDRQEFSQNIQWPNPGKNDVVTDKWTNWAISGYLAHFWESKNFSKKFDSISFECYGPSTSCKIWKNQRVNNPDKNPAVTNKWTNWGILGFSGPFSGKREFSQKIWLRQLWVLMVPQLHAKCLKKLMSQSWKKYCDKKMDVPTDRLTQFHRTLAKHGSNNSQKCSFKKWIYVGQTDPNS